VQFRSLCRIGKELLSVSAAFLVSGCCVNCSTPLPPAEADPPENVIFYKYEVVRAYPHDPGAFTQGVSPTHTQPAACRASLIVGSCRQSVHTQQRPPSAVER